MPETQPRVPKRLAAEGRRARARALVPSDRYTHVHTRGGYARVSPLAVSPPMTTETTPRDGARRVALSDIRPRFLAAGGPSSETVVRTADPVQRRGGPADAAVRRRRRPLVYDILRARVK